MILFMDTEQNSPRDVITAALRLARVRATGTAEEKKIRRERLSDLILRATLLGDDPSDPGRPTAADFTEALGDPGDDEVRAAISDW